MKNGDYASMSGYLRVLEKRLLNSNSIERIIDLRDAQETAKAISQSSEYDFTALEKPEDYEKILSASLKKTYKELYDAAPDKLIMDIILAKYDYHNLKTAIKSKYLGKNEEHLYIDYTETAPVWITDTVINETKHEKLPANLIEAVSFVSAAYEQSGNPQSIDVLCDSQMFKYQIGLANAADNDFVKEYVKFTVDFYNIKALLRVKNMNRDLKFLRESLCEGGKIPAAAVVEHYDKNTADLADIFRKEYFGGIIGAGIESYDKTGSFSELERLLDNFLVEYMKKSKFISFGPELLLSYIFSKENEVRQIRIIMTCKINNIPPSVLRERLRDNYA